MSLSDIQNVLRAALAKADPAFPTSSVIDLTGGPRASFEARLRTAKRNIIHRGGHGKQRRLLCVISALCLNATLVAARADQLAFSDWQRLRRSTARERHSQRSWLTTEYMCWESFASGNSFTLYNDVQTAVLGNDGAIVQGSWKKTTPFPEPRSGLGVAAYKGSSMWSRLLERRTLADVQYAA